MCVQLQRNVISSTFSSMNEDKLSSMPTTKPYPIKSCLKIKTQEESVKSVSLSSLSSSLQPEKNSIPCIFEVNSRSDPYNTDKQKKCRFKHVDVRPCIRALGDNPCVMEGPPLTLSWKYYETEHFSIDEYEAMKPPRIQKRAERLNALTRDELLRDAGYSRREILTAERNIRDIRKSRSMSANQPIAMQKIEEGTASLHRKLNRWFKRKPGDKEMYEKWIKAQHSLEIQQEEGESPSSTQHEQKVKIKTGDEDHFCEFSPPTVAIGLVSSKKTPVAGRTA